MKLFLNEIKDIANNTIKKGYTVCLIIKTNEKMSQEAYSFLTKSEQEHADKFIHAVDRHMSIISHAIKRHTISILTSIPELNLYFNCNAYGKPECTLENSPFFNISHSNKFVAIGFSLYKPLGVDIEFPRDNDYKSISSDCLNQQELSEYKDSDFNKHYFITRWTQKEALTKMNGAGLNHKFNEIEINLTEDNNIFSSFFFDQEAFIHTSSIEDGILSICQESKKKISTIKTFYFA